MSKHFAASMLEDYSSLQPAPGIITVRLEAQCQPIASRRHICEADQFEFGCSIDSVSAGSFAAEHAHNVCSRLGFQGGVKAEGFKAGRWLETNQLLTCVEAGSR